ncbi:hypothetical protein N2152v2_002031 [Parachlorella kessleri]
MSFLGASSAGQLEQPEVTSQPPQTWKSGSTGASVDTSVAASVVASAAALPASIILPCPSGYLVVRRTRQYAVRSASSPITQPSAASRLRELLARLQRDARDSAGLGDAGEAQHRAAPVAAAPSQLPLPTAQQWPASLNLGPAQRAPPTYPSRLAKCQQHPLLLPQQQAPLQQQWPRQCQQLAVEAAVSCSPSPMPSLARSPQQPATSCSSTSSASSSAAALAVVCSGLQPATPVPEQQASRLS